MRTGFGALALALALSPVPAWAEGPGEEDLTGCWRMEGTSPGDGSRYGPGGTTIRPHPGPAWVLQQTTGCNGLGVLEGRQLRVRFDCNAAAALYTLSADGQSLEGIWWWQADRRPEPPKGDLGTERLTRDPSGRACGDVPVS